jgi:hypothetical protein
MHLDSFLLSSLIDGEIAVGEALQRFRPDSEIGHMARPNSQVARWQALATIAHYPAGVRL